MSKRFKTAKDLHGYLSHAATVGMLVTLDEISVELRVLQREYDSILDEIKRRNNPSIFGKPLGASFKVTHTYEPAEMEGGE